MQGPSTLRVALAFFALVIGCTPPAEAGTRKALLIGINDYVVVPDLRGAVNDIDMVEELLITRLGFEPDDVERLTNTDATREGILAALDRLAERVQPGDFVYLHYSGHGSQVQDLSGDETDDGRDETLISHDGRSEGVPDITDDELAQRLGKLRSDRVVIVLDSCHSGTATRGVFLQTRSVPPDDRIDLYDATRTRAVVPLVQGDHLLLTGAASNQEALDGPVDGRPHGLFSYALARTLSNAPADVTPRDVMAGVERELERIKAQLGMRAMPEPQLEAVSERIERPLFAAAAPDAGGPGQSASAPAPEEARLPWLDVRPAGAGRVALVRGPRLGGLPGSVWAIYPPGETKFAPGGALAEAEVVELSGNDSLAKLTPGDARVPDGARATAIAAAPAEESLPVRWLDADAGRAARLQAALSEKLAAVAFVGEDEFARFAVEFEPARVRVLGADLRSEIAALALDDEAQLVSALAVVLTRWLTAAELLSLDNAATAIQLELAVAGTPKTKQEQGPERGILLVADTGAPVLRIRRAGEPRSASNSLQLEVKSDTDCYLTLVDVDSAGVVSQLFPNPISQGRGFHPDGRISAGEIAKIPDSLASGNAAGFHFDYAPPTGTDTVRAFCTADLALAQALRGAIGKLSPTAETRGVGAGPSQVRATLIDVRESLVRASSRGIKLVADEPAPAAEPTQAQPPAVPGSSPDWAASSITLEVSG